MISTRFVTRFLTRSRLTTFKQPLTTTPFLCRHRAPARGARWCSTLPNSPPPPPPEKAADLDKGYTRESIILEGCDFEHWLVVMQNPQGEPQRDQIIDRYVKIAALALGSEEEARMKIYSVSTKHYYAFGAVMSGEQADKLKELPGVTWVLPDSYLDIQNKDYGGEPFINGQAVPYDPKYHEEWVRNNARQKERIKRNAEPDRYDRADEPDRPPNTGRVSTGDSGSNMAGGSQGNMRPNMGGRPQRLMDPNMVGALQRNMGPNMSRGQQGNVGPDMAGGSPMRMSAPPDMGGMPPQNGGMQPNNRGTPPNYSSGPRGGPSMGGGAPPNMGGMPPLYGGMQPNFMGSPPPNYNAGSNMGGMPPQYAGIQPNDMGNPLNYNTGPNMGGYPNNQQNFSYGNGPYNEGVPYQSGPIPNQADYVPNNGNSYHDHDYPGRDYQ